MEKRWPKPARFTTTAFAKFGKPGA